MAIETVIEMLGGPSAKAWKMFEYVVAAMHGASAKDVVVGWDEIINGRQFDVTLRFQRAMHSYLTVIECKNFSSRIPVEKVDALVTKARDVLANKAVMVSAVGYQSGALEVAKRHGVKLLTLEEVFEPVAEMRVKERVRGVNVFDAKLHLVGRGEYAFEEFTSKGEYLWKQSKIDYRGVSGSVDSWAKANRPEAFKTLPPPDTDEEISLEFSDGAVWSAPYEDSAQITRFSFKRRAIDMVIPADSVEPIDRYLYERMGMVVKVIDEEGAVLGSARLQDLALDFNTELKPGKFYRSTSLGFHYFLEKEIGDLLYWVLLESYQHGHLMQSTYSQRREHSKRLIEVEDPIALVRLRKMLAAFQARREKK